jgi:phosphinothricin acetyltransferase
MAEAYLNVYGEGLFEAESAGLEAGRLNPYVVRVMKDDGIDLSGNKTKRVDDFLAEGRKYDDVITVCDEAGAEKCPIFPGLTKRIGWPFPDPSALQGSEEELLEGTRKLRDAIKQRVLSYIKEAMLSIEPMSPEQWPEVSAIYEQGIKTGNATFETSAPSWEAWDRGHMKDCRLVAIEEVAVLGWAALTPVSDRCVYAGVAEVSVYVSEQARGRGIGRKLLQELIEQSEKKGIWTLQAGIFPENAMSIKIHEDCGFRIMGRRERIGKMNGIWRDTLIMERRSSKAGI